MEQKQKIIRASLISPLLVLLPLALLAIVVLSGEIFQIPGLIEPDDAPARAAGLILFVIIPVFYPVLAVGMIFLGHILKYFEILSRKNLYIVCVVVSSLVGVRLGWPSPYGVKDQIIGLCVFFPIVLFSLMFGAYFWWRIANGKRKK